jgi:hypothetical protein
MSIFLFLIAADVFDRCESIDDCLWRGVMTKEQVDALEPALSPWAPDNLPKAAGKVGFLNVLSKVTVSLTTGVEGAAGSDGDGLGRCVFCISILLIIHFAVSEAGDSAFMLSILEAVTPSRLSSA